MTIGKRQVIIGFLFTSHFYLTILFIKKHFFLLTFCIKIQIFPFCHYLHGTSVL